MIFSSPSTLAVLCLVAFSSWTSAHTVITYPGWRGNNLRNSSDIVTAKGLGVDTNSSSPDGLGYPYGMQWIYPCTSMNSLCATCSRRIRGANSCPTGGGQPISQNRTKWPVKGGAIGIQPGWFSGHASAFFYINLGEGSIPLNYSLPMVPVFQITGPSNTLYNGSFCLGQVPLPANYTAVVGNNATIQVIETAQHGAALYNVGFAVHAIG